MVSLQGLFALENKVIGKGCFGTVYLGTDIANDKYVALKKIPPEIKNDAQKIQALSNEILISAGVENENLVKILDLTDINNDKYIVYEFCNGGDLGRYLKYFRSFDEVYVQYFMKQILSGLSELHAKKIIHHDLKPENVLVELIPYDIVNKYDNQEKKKFEKTIEDILKLTDPKNNKNQQQGNIGYSSVNKDFVLKTLLKSKIKVSDFGLSKFKEDNNQKMLSGSLIEILKRGVYFIDLRQCEKISKQFLSFLNMCLQKPQNIRPNVNELLFSEFITREPSKFDYITLNNLNMIQFPNPSYVDLYNGRIIMNIFDQRSLNAIFDF